MKIFEKGIFYENLACKILRKKNLEIIGQRIKSKFGEIDILAQCENDFYIVEVKFRKFLENASYSITEKQFNRSLSTFFDYTSKHNLKFDQYFYIAILFCPTKYKIINVLDFKSNI